MARNSTIGSVYLLHFERPLEHAQHYLGWALDVATRVDEHLAGDGSPLVAAAIAAGIHVELVRTWQSVDRHFERKLKRRGSSRPLCPRCRDAFNRKKAAALRARRKLKVKEG